MQDWFGYFPNFSATTQHDEIWGLCTNRNSLEILTNQVQAKNYLTWSDRFNPQLDLVREALKRPYARLNGDYSVPHETPIPAFVAFRYFSLNLTLRAKCDLLLGKPADALNEIAFLDQFRNVLNLPPSGKPMLLITTMINISITGGYYTPVIEAGLKTHAWDEQQLECLRKQLQPIRLPPLLINAIHAENAHSCNLSETSILTETRSIRLRRGLLQGMVTVTELDQQAVGAFDPTAGIISPDKMDEWKRKYDALETNDFSADEILAGIDTPDLTHAWQTTAYDQTLVNEALIGCALERYRLAHGEYPKTLDALTPRYMETIPHDIIGGKPMRYRRTADGKFLLYSIGWNERDDGGQESRHDKNGMIEYTNGDWVLDN